MTDEPKAIASLVHKTKIMVFSVRGRINKEKWKWENDETEEERI